MKTAIRAKMNRGPANGKRFNVEGHQEILLIASAPRDLARPLFKDGLFMGIETHEYRRSHRTLKDGTVIYEWMGKISG